MFNLSDESAVWSGAKERRFCDRHDVGSKPTRSILLRPWERYFTGLFPTWQFSQTIEKFQSYPYKTKKAK